ncbi:hypothetical protein MHC_03720 [Mycoplasma haemocanis str. Illinois]|uniref:Uncharacterized protein n=1 Tax=Mycoplasma haemocanis (strain Illinois) TaxID=1111676 RepID=H6N7I2_MYCHN|nr:hypothetical protein [Mycoplasma haemocanis]AEW45604.1 hypothetical protein MHC_03720 [Mycoplasma haemocanis str. Illinois]
MAFIPKLFILGVVAGGVSIGFGIESLAFSNSSTKLTSKSRINSINQGCRLHKLMAINKGQSEGRFELTTKDEIREKEKPEEVDFDSIERACLSNAGKDIFISKKKGKWGYYEQDQSDEEHKNKFERYLGKTSSTA